MWTLHATHCIRWGRTTPPVHALLRAQARKGMVGPPTLKRLILFFPAPLLFQSPQMDQNSSCTVGLSRENNITALYIPTWRDGGGGVGKQDGKDRCGGSNCQWFSFVILETLSDSSCSRFRYLLSKARILVKADNEKRALRLSPPPPPALLSDRQHGDLTVKH